MKDCYFRKGKENPKSRKIQQAANVTACVGSDDSEFCLINMNKKKTLCDNWFIDSGATCHMSNNHYNMENLRKIGRNKIRVANGQYMLYEEI